MIALLVGVGLVATAIPVSALPTVLKSPVGADAGVGSVDNDGCASDSGYGIVPADVEANVEAHASICWDYSSSGCELSADLSTDGPLEQFVYQWRGEASEPFGWSGSDTENGPTGFYRGWQGFEIGWGDSVRLYASIFNLNLASDSAVVSVEFQCS